MSCPFLGRWCVMFEITAGWWCGPLVAGTDRGPDAGRQRDPVAVRVVAFDEAAALFRGAHGRLGAAERGVGVAAGGGEESDADAQGHGFAGDDGRVVQRSVERRGELAGRLGGGDGELVAAEADQDVVGADDVGESLRRGRRGSRLRRRG